MRQCPLDGADLADDREICPGCENATRGRLRAVPDLLDELDTSLARIGSTWRGDQLGRGGSGTCPRVEGADGQMHPCLHEPDSRTCTEGARLGMSLAASDAALQLRTVLHGWARIWDEETPIPQPDPAHYRPDVLAYVRREARRYRDWAIGTTARQAILLAEQPLAGRPWAGDLAREIRDAVRAAERAIDRPPDLDLAGTCTCGMAVYATPGDRTVHCRWCGANHNPAELYDAMLQARGQLYAAPAAIIARALTDPATGKPLVTAAQIRGWRYRGFLEVALTNEAGQPCYRIADVAKLAREGAPEPEETTCPS